MAPFSFQTDYVPVMSVCCERVRVCVMGRASPAMYPLAYCFAGVSPPRNPFSKNKNWTFLVKRGFPSNQGVYVVPTVPLKLHANKGTRFALRVSVVDAPRFTPAFTVKLHRTPNPCGQPFVASG